VSATTVAPLATYRNALPYPFCPGCGHGPILDRLDEALVLLDLDPARVVLVSDIGCAGLSDQYFATSAFHGLHGRSITYASGIKLARPELEVIVLMGDGGTGIGGAHLLSAARRNLGITVVVFNNFNYGMTGGQHSATTPPAAVTSTTPTGNLERPLDLCATVAANGAAYAWRGTSFDADLAERIAEAVRTPGFALVDVWELCTAHFVPNNRASKRTLGEMLEGLGFATGPVARREVPEYGAAYRAAAAGAAAVPSSLAPAWLQPRFPSSLDRRFGLVVAGAAGGRVRSAARLLARAAVLSGLWAAQRDDYPVTVKTGHSVSELVLSPEPIERAGVESPDAVLVLAEEGRRKVAGRAATLSAAGTLVTLPGLAAIETPARRRPLDPSAAATRFAKADLSLVAVAATAVELGLVPPEALEEAARQATGGPAESALAAVRAGLEIAAVSA